jgi:hypothetical protein
MIYRRLFLLSFELVPPPLPSLVSKLSIFLSLCVCRRSCLLTGEGGGGARSYDGENSCSSINHSILFAVWPCLTVEAGLIRIYEVRG